MDNKTKQYLSSLEQRVLRLESTIEGMINGAQNNANNNNYITCNQCGRANPSVCSVVDCCQGLNPNDDLKDQQENKDG
jgi:hypothetical protein